MKQIRYKLATRDRTTHGGFKLPPDGEWFYPEDRTSEPQACTNTVLHHYAHPLLAVLFNPIHGNYSDPVLFEIEIDEEIGTDGLKGWCRAQRIVREVPVPVITPEQRAAFSIYCAEPFNRNPAWGKWASAWLNGSDRSSASVSAASAAAYTEAERAPWPSAWAESAAAAARSAWAAAAARAAARGAAAEAKGEEWAARAAAWAARGEWAARAAAWAARAAEVRAEKYPDFLALIQRVFEEVV